MLTKLTSSIAVLLIGLSSYYFIKASAIDAVSLKSAASAFASVGVTMLGFMLAMLAILVSMSDRRLVRNMDKTGHLRKFLMVVYWTGAYFALSMLASLIALFLDSSPLIVAISIASGTLSGAMFLLCFVGASFWRVLTIGHQANTPLE